MRFPLVRIRSHCAGEHERKSSGRTPMPDFVKMTKTCVRHHRVFVVLMAKEFLRWSIPNQNLLFQLGLQCEVRYLLLLVVQGWVRLCQLSYERIID